MTHHQSVPPIQDSELNSSNSSNAHGEKSSETNNLQENINQTPWFIQIFLGLSGLFSGLAIVGFLVLLLLSSIDERSTQTITGLILVAASMGLFYGNKSTDNVFLLTLAFAISVAGQLFLIVAIFFENSYSEYPYLVSKVLALLLLQAILAIAIPNLFHRVVNLFVTLGCMVWLLSYFNAPEVSAGFIALISIVFSLQRIEFINLLLPSPSKCKDGLRQFANAVAYASTFLLLVISVYFIGAEFGHDIFRDSHGYLSEFTYHYALAQSVLVLACLYAAYILLQRYRVALISKTSSVIALAIIILGIVSFYVAGLLATSLVILLAFANRERLLVFLGIAALFGYIFWYYYQLDTSLLTKSASMLAVGITLLITRWLLIDKYFKDKQSHQSSQPQSLNTAPQATSTSLNSVHTADNTNRATTHDNRSTATKRGL